MAPGRFSKTEVGVKVNPREGGHRIVNGIVLLVNVGDLSNFPVYDCIHTPFPEFHEGQDGVCTPGIGISVQCFNIVPGEQDLEIENGVVGWIINNR